MLKSKFIAILLITLSVIFIFNVNLSLAQVNNAQSPSTNCTGTNCDIISLGNPLAKDGENPTVNTLVGRVITAVLGVVGSLALLMFVYGGITWMTSSGSPEKVKKGKDIIIWSVIGLAIIFFSYALVNFVIYDIIGG
ncbi:MAG TPA: pilin [Patescibacteria group bacterium]|nr:pilin [Patescibacteria group bacterium]